MSAVREPSDAYKKALAEMLGMGQMCVDRIEGELRRVMGTIARPDEPLPWDGEEE